jgi:8-oxo-dGTP diphosphatase
VAKNVILAASAVMVDPHNRVLLVKRGHEPAKDLWSVPGGSVEPGEDLATAVVREVWEETALEVQAGDQLWVATVELSPEADYEIHAFRATVLGGKLQPGDDAADAKWVTPQEFVELATTPRLSELLAQAGWPHGPASA